MLLRHCGENYDGCECEIDHERWTDLGNLGVGRGGLAIDIRLKWIKDLVDHLS